MSPVPHRCLLGVPGWSWIHPARTRTFGINSLQLPRPQQLSWSRRFQLQIHLFPSLLEMGCNFWRWSKLLQPPASSTHHPEQQTKPKQDKKQHLIIRQDLWGLMYSIKCGNKNIQLLIVSFWRWGPQATSSLALPFYGVTAICWWNYYHVIIGIGIGIITAITIIIYFAAIQFLLPLPGYFAIR